MENNTAPAPVQPLAPASTRQKVSLNPFAHIWLGVRDLFATNAVAAIVASTISVLVSFGFGLLFVLMIGSMVDSFSPLSGSLTTVFAKFIGFIVIVILISGYTSSVVARTVLTGTRREKIGLAPLFPFALKRYPIVVLTYLAIGAVFMLGFAAILLLAHIQPILGIIASIAGLVASIIFALRVSYVQYVAIDDEKPTSVMWVIQRSTQLWKNSGGALVLYIITIIVLAVVLQMVTGDATTPQTTPTYNSDFAYAGPTDIPGGNAVAYGSLVVFALIQGIFGLLISAAIGHIYNEARYVTDGKVPTDPTAPGAPPTATPLPVASAAPVFTAPSAPTPPTAAEPMVTPDHFPPQ